MGTWDTGTFDNDDAMDWAAELADGEDLGVCERSLNPQELQGYYLQAPDCVSILCAGEVLAALRGRPSPRLPEEVQQWVGGHSQLNPTPLVPLALAKIDRVLAEHSELDELWKENETDYPAWRAAVQDLRSRLGG